MNTFFVRIVSVGAVFALAIVSNSFARVGDQAWSFQTGDAVVSSPALDSSGNVYFGSIDGNVYSLDKDGVERWSRPTGDWVESSAALSPDESVVYIGSWDNRLYALSSETGAVLWSYETGSLVFSSPAVAQDGTIYFGGSDGFLYSLSPAGELNWEEFLGGELDSSVAIGPSGHLYVATSEGFVYSIASDSGEIRWSFELPTEPGASDRDTEITASCVLEGDGSVYIGSKNYFFYALDTADGSVRWRYETGGIIEASATRGVDGSVIVSSQDGYVYAFNPDGSLAWRTDIGANYYTSAVVDELGRIYASSYIDETLSYLNVLTPDGVIAQRVPFTGIIDSSIALSSDAQLYLGNNDGRLYAFENGARLSNSVWPNFRSGVAARGSVEGYSPPVANKERLYNIALRGAPLGGEEDIFTGFAIEGTGQKTLLLRAVGPGLADFGVTEYMEDPSVVFYDKDGSFGDNDDWGDSASSAVLPEEMARVGAFSLETGSSDSADLLTLGSGLYSAIMGKGDAETGVALIEVYNADPDDSEASLSNVSMRGPSGTGQEVLIAGFVIEGNLPKRLLLRAIGPGMVAQGVNNVLVDPTLRLMRGNTEIEFNDDWESHPDSDRLQSFMSAAGAFALDEGSADSAVFVWLEPGLYTVIVGGNNGGTGVALVEIYDLTGK